MKRLPSPIANMHPLSASRNFFRHFRASNFKKKSRCFQRRECRKARPFLFSAAQNLKQNCPSLRHLAAFTTPCLSAARLPITFSRRAALKSEHLHSRERKTTFLTCLCGKTYSSPLMLWWHMRERGT